MKFDSFANKFTGSQLTGSLVMLKNIKQVKGTIDYQTPYHWKAGGVTREIQMRRLRFARKYITQRDSVLDIGCGDGFLTNALADYCEHVVGVDSSRTGIALACTLADASNADFVLGSVDNLPFKENTFNVITLFEVIEHIPVGSVKNALADIRRVLKKDGVLIVTTPNSRNLENIIYRRTMVSKKHEKEYSQSELLSRMSDFEKVELSGIYFPLPPLTLLYKLRYRFLWQMLFPLAGWFPKLARFITYCGRKK